MKTVSSMISLFYLFGILLSCHKNSPEPNIAASEYFPNTVGNYWEYEVSDSSTVREHPEVSTPYTVKVSIAGHKTLIDGIDATIWKYEYPWGIDTNYIRVVNDTVKVFDLIYSRSLQDLQYPRIVFIIPFTVEQRWDGKLTLIDSFHVYNAPSVFTPTENFENCFNIYHYYYGPNSKYNDNYWFKPNVGMVAIYTNHYDLAPRNIYLWRLKKYYLH
jgi:hypothetical protein